MSGENFIKMKRGGWRPAVLLTALCLLPTAVLTTGCRQDMHDQPKYTPLRPSNFFNDGRSARPLVEGTVARGQLKEDDLLFTGKSGGATTPTGQAASGQGFADTFPFPVTQAVMDRGQERYNIFCSMCHDRTGNGQGMVVRRGYRQPPSLHLERLRQAPAGYFFDVMTNGFGAMPDYASQIPVKDRWAIIAYIRALQLSEQGTVNQLSPAEREKLNSQK